MVVMCSKLLKVIYELYDLVCLFVEYCWMSYCSFLMCCKEVC